MVYKYVGYREGGEMVKGRLSAASEEAAINLLGYAGYRVVHIEQYVPFLSLDRLLERVSRVKKPEIILFYRQLALLLESGINIVTSLELLQDQTSDRILKNVFDEVIADLRRGNQLSVALGKYPEIFSVICQRSLQVGEQTGNFELILRQIADHLEKEVSTTKSLKNALRLPVITAVIALLVVGLLTTFVLPAFTDLYKSLGAELPTITRIFLSAAENVEKYGLHILLAMLIIGVSGILYIRTPKGKGKWDRLLLRLPLPGRIIHLSERSRVCRSISLLYGSGLPLAEIAPLVIQSVGNSVLAGALLDVQKDMLKGEGLSAPMSKNRLFLPMMVQMVKVGEETGNLDGTLLSVAKSYEAEVEDKTRSLIATIQPAMTLAIGLVIGLVALSLTSAMYSIYGQGMGS